MSIFARGGHRHMCSESTTAMSISKRGNEVIPRLSVLIGAYFADKLGNQVI